VPTVWRLALKTARPPETKSLDDRGRLYLRGREREEINKGGMKIYPADIDAVVERFAATRDVCTFAFPDALHGESVGVAAVLDARSDEALAELYAWCAQHLAAHQLPSGWYLVDEIPRTSRGKINREAVARRCAEPPETKLPARRAGATRCGVAPRRSARVPRRPGRRAARRDRRRAAVRGPTRLAGALQSRDLDRGPARRVDRPTAIDIAQEWRSVRDILAFMAARAGARG
jgi:hypothetical protein